jgi:hypothetical protein
MGVLPLLPLTLLKTAMRVGADPGIKVRVAKRYLRQGICRRFFKMFSVFLLFCYYLPLGTGVALHLKTFASPNPKDDLCQVWLKLAQWFWRSPKCKKNYIQTDDGQRAIRKAHLKFQLRWAKNLILHYIGKLLCKFQLFCFRLGLEKKTCKELTIETHVKMVYPVVAPLDPGNQEFDKTNSTLCQIHVNWSFSGPVVLGKIY